MQVHAHLCGGYFYKDGEVRAYDFHYNLAVIRFSSPAFGPAKGTAHSVDVRSRRRSQPPFPLIPNSRSCKLTPGDRVIVMGRYFAKPFDIMAAPGEYWLVIYMIHNFTYQLSIIVYNI